MIPKIIQKGKILQNKRVESYGRELTFSMLLKLFIARIVATKSLLVSIAFQLFYFSLFFAICFYIYCSIYQLRILSRSSKQ